MSNIDKYTSFISEQSRTSPMQLTEATEKTAVKHELKNLNQHLGGSVADAQRTGRGTQMTSPSVNVSHHKSSDETHKALTAAGYKHIKKPSPFYSDDHKFYQKTDSHGFTHTLAHSGSAVHHIGASKSS
jgi:hypothetical protein